jgi:hypothetical protein
MKWMAPGSLGDMGANRQYTFLMYEQPGQFMAKAMPQQGQPINMQDFVQQNGLQNAVAGQTMVVNTQNAAQLGMGSSMSGMPAMPTGAMGMASGTMTGGMSAQTPGSPNAKAAANAASSMHQKACAAGIASAAVAFWMASMV